jgi:3-hydroxybutyrate dehydrogenase
VVVDLLDTKSLASAELDCDILVNNAGIQVVSPIEDFPPESFHRILMLMFEAPFLSRAPRFQGCTNGGSDA